jgi:hypothetical protein
MSISNVLFSSIIVVITALQSQDMSRTLIDLLADGGEG